jgi:hypothetical protein
MTMQLKKTIAALCFATVLAGCGGGGGGNNDTPAFGVQDPQIQFLPNRPSLLSNPFGYPVEANTPFFSQLDMRIIADNGRNPPDNTIVTLRSSDLEILTLSVLDRGDTQDVNEFATRFGTICEGTVGGLATFFIHSSSAKAGVAVITASVQIPLTAGEIQGAACRTNFASNFTSVSRNFDYVVNPSTPFQRLELRPERTTISVNPLNIPPTLGYAFATPIEVTQRDPLGRLVSSVVTATSVTPDVLLLSTPNAFATLTASAQQTAVAGRSLFYVHTLNRQGPAVVRFRSTDPTTGGTVQNEVTFTITGGSNSAPSQISISTDQRALYSQGSGGNTTLPVQARIIDDLGQSIPDAPVGVNNVTVDIVNVQSGEVLVGRNAAGQTLERASISTRTLAGIANLVLRSGSGQGIYQLRATADRADNNVDNGVQSPLTTTRPVIISDGKLFDLEITSPRVNAILINGVAPPEDLTVEAVTLPNDPNATYSLTVSALGTDRQGNPVIPGTPIEFGLIDHPASGFPLEGPGSFLIAGNDGDPVEGGVQFNAPTGSFLTAGGGVGPGDTLLVYGEENIGNRDLESARRVARVVSQTQLDIQASTRFNLNDDSTNGVPVNRGPVLAYAVGRATFANIDNNKLTNDQGVASTKLNYPASAIGRLTAVWARGIGDTPVGQTSPELVTDVENFVYPGVGGIGTGAALSASPSAISSGQTTVIRVCLRDSISNPIAGVFPRFSITGGSGTVDGVANNGRVQRATNRDGCTDVTANVIAGGGTTTGGGLNFTALGLTANVTIAANGGVRLIAIPERLGGSGGRVVLRLIDVAGFPLPDVQVTGTCNADSGGSSGVNTFVAPTIIDQPGRTNAAGETSAGISAALDGFNAAARGVCTFTALGATAVVTLQGVDICQFNFSPRPRQCTAATPAPTFALTIRLAQPNGINHIDPAPNFVSVFANAGGINCTSANTAGCVGQVRQGDTVTLIAAANGSAQFCRWTGDAQCTGISPTLSINMTEALTCVGIFTSVAQPTCPAN